MKLVNTLGLPEPIFRAIQNDPYDPGDSDYTPTSLSTPVRIRALMKRHGDGLVEEAAGRFWAFLGQAVHAVLERTDMAGMLKEQRVYAEVAGRRIGAQFDLYDPAARHAYDFKITSVWSYVFNGGKAKPEWEAQGNIIAYLLRRNGLACEAASNIAILRDWQESKARQEPDYPKLPAIQVPLPSWPDAKTETWITGRVLAHEATEGVPDAALPLCTPEERWDRPSTWAVYRNSNKRATKVCADEPAALAFVRANPGDKLRIEERPGKSVRCVDYCPVVSLCAFGRSTKAAAEDAA